MLELLSNIYVLVIIAVWELFWKGWALWRAGTNKDKKWFIVLFVLNTVGILPIIYLFLIKPIKKKRKK